MHAYEEKEENSKAKSENVIIDGILRITVLTERLLRIEKGSLDSFIDMPTQGVINRNLGEVKFNLCITDKKIEVETDKTFFCISKADIKQSYAESAGKKAKFFSNSNFGGTLRTLDNNDKGADGKDSRIIENRYGLKLCEGLVSKNGVAVIDDGKSLILNEDGTICKRKEEIDLYVFVYGKDYRAALFDFYRLTGFPPVIPKFAFGNWWSRYHAYTQAEYIALLDEFKERNIPLSVATVDMDWHNVDVDKKFGITKKGLTDTSKYGALSGWTGYTWNEELFPDYKEFLREIKKRGLKTTLNVHPADGVRWFETQYSDFAKAMGVEPESKKCISFDLTDEKFVKNYFELLHRPYEKEGVDFWWIDWQQGTKTKVKNLDPLWLLNHLHYKDNSREKQGLILSRYCGAGAHRYPLGFSGDTSISWKTLDYLPFFTASATNIGFTWWSHDIGGHFHGEKDDELAVRWLQFGVFSPINRLHSSNMELLGKEPWNYERGTELILEDIMRLRHKLIPYLYTYSHLTAKSGIALIEPIYYEEPNDKRAYKYGNEYRFGELLVAPITKKSVSSKIGLVKAFLPKGKYTDIFNGNLYEGDRELLLCRDMGSIPVLAKEGTILPLSIGDGCAPVPKELDVYVFSGNGSFTLKEDKGGKRFETRFIVKKCGKRLIVSVISDGDDEMAIERKIHLNLRNVYEGRTLSCEVDGNPVQYDLKQNGNVKISFVFSGKRAETVLNCEKDSDFYFDNPMEYVKLRILEIIRKLNEKNAKKAEIYGRLMGAKDGAETKKIIEAQKIPLGYKSLLLETLCVCK